MEVFKHAGTEDTPTIIFDPNSNIFEFSGRSMPENAVEFYVPVLNFIEGYGKNPNQETVVAFKFEYFNTSSAKVIMDILSGFEKILHAGKSVIVKWHYMEDDEDMLEAGEGYAGIVEIPFEYIKY